MKYYIIAGEASGDIHGANLMRSLLENDPKAQFRFWGGDAMEEVSGKAVKHIKELAFMGFWEVLKNLSTILGFIRFCKKDISQFQPDVIILLDYPGFNLRIAKWAKKEGFKVIYYIVPQVWAWHKSRVHSLRLYTNKLIAILPFESDFYEKNGCSVEYVGHPLLDEIERKNHLSNELPTCQVALLPGSRQQEIKHMLPLFIQAVNKLNVTYFIAASPNIPISFYHDILRASGVTGNLPPIYQGRMYDILRSCEFAFVTSGTATLETALMRVPQIVAYKGSFVSYSIAKALISLRFISLVNLILDEALVTELIQNELTVENLTKSYQVSSQNKPTILDGYERLRKKLGESGASDRASVIIIKEARQ